MKTGYIININNKIYEIVRVEQGDTTQREGKKYL